MNPYRLKDVFNYLTSNNQLLKRKLKLGTDEIPTPPKRSDVTTIEAINRFNKANPRVDTTNLKPLSVKQSNVKQSNVKQSNVDQADEGVIQGAFDTATREAQSEGFPAPKYEAFKKRYLRKNMKADGGMLVQSSDDGSRPGYKEDKKNIYPREKGTDKYKLSEAYKKSITPKGYVDVQDLIELIDNPKLTQNVFTQARKFEKNPKKYPGRKNYVYNKIISLLGEKKFHEEEILRMLKKIFYKKPTKKQIDTLTNFIDSKILETGTVKNLEILDKEFGKLFQGKKPKGFFTNTLTLDKARNVFLKKYGIKATDSQLARAMMRLGQVYDGQLFQNDINISKNKTAANFIDKSFNEIDMFSGWRSASYDAALDDISKNMPKKAGDVRNFKTTLNDYIKQNYPKVFKKYDVNEIFSVTTSSVRGSYPYSYFVDLTKSDVNQKLLANFQGQASKAEGQIQKAIANYRRTGNVKFYEEALSVANKFNTVNRKKFLSDERVIKAGGANAVKLEIGSQQQIKDKIGFANEYYKQNNLDKWKSQGIDIDAHTGKSGYVKTLGTKTVPKGVSTFTDLVQDGEVNEKEVKRILQNIQGYSKLPQCKVGAADGGRIGFAYSDECIRDGLKEQKIEAQKGNKKAAQELVQTAKVATRAGLLKNLLGPGAILGEAVYEGAVMGNKILGGKELNEAWAESYLSGLDPLEVRRKNMITREDFSDPDYAEDPYTLEMVKQGESKTIDGPNANILRSGFAAQDQVSAFNEAVNEKLRGESANRFDIANRAAADVREQGRFVDQSKDIISSDAFQEATRQAQEFMQGQTGENIAKFKLGDFGKYESGQDRDRRREREKEMQALGGTYLDYKNPYTKKEYEDFARKKGILPSDRQFTDKYFTNEILNPVRFNQLMQTPSFKGASEKFASGGIASLTKTIPPPSGPTPHGLRYPYNNVKKIKE